MGIENIRGSGKSDELTGNGSKNTLEGGAGDDILDGGNGNDELYGGAGDDTYIFSGVGQLGSDNIYDVAGDTMTLRFDSANPDVADQAYVDRDFTTSTIARNVNDLEITLTKDIRLGFSTTNIITIKNAYNAENTLAFTIEIEYGDSVNGVAFDSIDTSFLATL